MAKKVKTSEKVITNFKTPVDVTLDRCLKAIKVVVAPEFRDEAMEIIKASNPEVCKEFLQYYDEDKGNICCLALDKAKQDLVAEGKLEIKAGDAFGHPFLL